MGLRWARFLLKCPSHGLTHHQLYFFPQPGDQGLRVLQDQLSDSLSQTPLKNQINTLHHALQHQFGRKCDRRDNFSRKWGL